MNRAILTYILILGTCYLLIGFEGYYIVAKFNAKYPARTAAQATSGVM
jgi:hypothetical protein